MSTSVAETAADGSETLHYSQYQVTKLRSWRTGYVRILRFYATTFATLDPESLKITNRWKYANLVEWIAVPEEPATLLLAVNNNSGGTTTTDKLKFVCHGTTRSRVLIDLLQRRGTVLYRQLPSSSSSPLLQAHRLNPQNGQMIPVQLQVEPYGIVEYTHAIVSNTYVYTRIRGVSLTTASSSASNTTTASSAGGLILHFQKNLLEPSLFYAMQNPMHRTMLFKDMIEYATSLGHDIPMEPSSLSIEHSPTSSIPTTYSDNATEDSSFAVVVQRFAATVVSTNQRVVLEITGNGRIVERDFQNHITHQRYLSDLYALVRLRKQIQSSSSSVASPPPLLLGDEEEEHPEVEGVRTTTTTTGLRLEYRNGEYREYTMDSRDSAIVDILDAARRVTKRHRNNALQITDVPTHRYRLLHDEEDEQENEQSQQQQPPSAQSALTSPSSTGSRLLSSLTQSSSSTVASVGISQYLLKRVFALSTHAHAILAGEYGSGGDTNAPPQPLHQRSSAIDATTLPQVLAVVTACREFNASYATATVGGMDYEETDNTVTPTKKLFSDKHVIGSVGALLGLVVRLLSKEGDEINKKIKSRNEKRESMAGVLLQSLHRLVQTTAGYKCAVEISALQECLPLWIGIEDVFTKFSAFSVLNVLLSGRRRRRKRTVTEPQQQDQQDREAEYVNKNVILKLGGKSIIEGVVSSLLPSEDHQRQLYVSDLMLMVSSDLLQSLLCSYHDTTSPEHFQAVMEALAARYRGLLNLLRSRTPFVTENAALLLHLLSTHAPQTAVAIREAALCSGTVLHHFHASTFSPLEGQRFLSRFLCSLWFAGPMDCAEKRLLKRMVPVGFIAFLKMPILSRMEEEQLDAIERDAVEGNVTDAVAAASATARAAAVRQSGIVGVSMSFEDDVIEAGTNTKRLRDRIAIADAAEAARSGNSRIKENFRIFFHVLTQDHSLADLIWSQQTRRELRIALESELEYIRRESEARGGMDAIAWNHQQFQVRYPSLENEVKVGNIYMRLWLHAGDAFIRSWDDPVRLFEHLFRRFLCEVDRDVKVTVMCIRCLERLYAIHASTIGPFTDVIILIHCMASTKNVETQHRLLGLLATVLGVSHDSIKDERYISSDIPENAEQLLNNESISQLCHFVAWGHTSPGQAGNLLSRLVGQTGKQLITDATSLGPGENRPVEDRPAANDLSCPAVWFVAPTGRNPPQPESIRGPFRVSALKEMITEGDLSPYHLATTSHVEEYDLDNPSETVTEAQIDTGKWKQINEIWQLRWQLCTDGSSSVIYTPVDVALLALKALVRLVDLHQSLDSRGIPFYPIPSAKRILCRTSREAMYASDRSSNSCETNPLPIICQAFLSSDSRIVELAAELLYKLCQHNDRAASKLYLSGVFYFVLCYTGNNFRTLAKLLHSVHLKQHFKSGFAAAADENEMPLKERSILGNVLPEGLLFILENYGADRFAEIFVGNADNPEVIWTFDMRKHLVEMIHQHLGDFPLRLHQNNTTEYEYCPMPGVAYKRLRKEMFCHNYYLENLCDENRFPDWPITEPLEVMRSCLEHFKSQVNHGKSSEEENLESARAVLCLNVGDGSKELRRAYRSMARKYHPDKNPSGREMFESIQKSYEILQLFLESGEKIPSISDSELKTESRYDQEIVFPTSNSQMQTMLHLVKTQIMICRRYEREMSRHSYPAYSVLFRCIELPKNIHEYTENNAILTSLFATSDRASFIQRVVELIFRTCLISPQNSEALVAEHGVPLLVCLLDFYVKVAQAYVASSPDPVAASTEKIVSVDTIAEIISHVVHTLSGVAFFPTGRDAIKSLPMLSEFLINWRRCLDESIFESKNDMALDSEMKRYALEGISYMAKDAKLQECLIGCGLVWPLLRYSLLYDSTLEQTIQDINSSDDVGFSVASINVAARHSIRALGVLSGLFGDDSPSNPALVVALDQLLTSPITRMLRNQRTGGILQVLNSTIERADILWNNQMRNQLEAFLRKIEKERPKSSCRTVEEELQPVTDFVYSVVGEEVIVGGIYIRFFNRGGKESLTYIDDPTRFFMSVTSYIAKSLNHAEHSFEWIKIPVEDEQSMDFCPSLKSQIFLHVLNALRILCRIDRLIDDVFCQTPNIAPSVLISLLELPLDSEAFDIGCDILYALSPRQSFADAVAKENSFWRLLHLLERKEPNDNVEDISVPEISDSSFDIRQRKARGWSVLEALSSSPSIANLILESSGWIELLGILVGYGKFTKLWTARIGASKTLSRLLWDPQTGAVAESLLRRLIPQSFATRLKEDPDTMLKNFDGETDTPEMIWDASMRSELRVVLGTQLDHLMEKRKERQSFVFSLDPDVLVRYTKLENELFIGGVYVSRFIKEPTYNLRDPTTFLELLLQRWSKELDAFLTGYNENKAPITTSSTLVKAGQDILDLVTTATVYLCKTRDALGDKLAAWGIMSRSMVYMEKMLEKELLGTPLLSVIRIVHVGSDRIANVEELAVGGNADQKRGVVSYLINAIGCKPLHTDSAFMIECLYKIYKIALGDLGKIRQTSKMKPNEILHQQAQQPFVAMSPSPAPGEGPVRKKVNIGDDPLGMLQASPQQPSGPMLMPAEQPARMLDQSTSTTLHQQPHWPGTTPLTLPVRQSVNQFGAQQGSYQQRLQMMSQAQTHHPNHVPDQHTATTYSNLSDPAHSCGPFHLTDGKQVISSLPSASMEQFSGQFVEAPNSSFSGLVQHQSQQNFYSPIMANPNHSPQPFQHSIVPNQRQLQQPSFAAYHHQQQPSSTFVSPQGMTSQMPTIRGQNSYPYLEQKGQQFYNDFQPSGRIEPPHSQQAQTSMVNPHTSGFQVQQYHVPNFSVQKSISTSTQFPSSSTVVSGSQSEMQGDGMAQIHDSYRRQNEFLNNESQPYLQPIQQPNVQAPQLQSAGFEEMTFHSRTTQAISPPSISGNPLGLPIVETVSYEHNSAVPQYGPTPIVGSGIDGRSFADPKVVAENRAVTSDGAPGAAKCRATLLQQAIECKLCEFLVEQVLENDTLKSTRDPAAAKVHAIALLKLLLKDPGFGLKFKIILDGLPAWKKYKSQDHSLLITSHEQRADYFLTGGSSAASKALITET